MKLLMYTQSLDKKDPLLGFFHRWVEEFSKHFEHIHVVCLREGEHTLPGNVTVHSLGKESGESKVKYIARFYRHLRTLSGTYDRVFVHMNPHYILLGGLYWKLSGIPIFFWRNHAKMNWMTRIAAPLSRHVFYTSPFACTARYAHAVKMPVGIDHEHFAPGERAGHDGPRRILFLGRISPVKRVELFVGAARFLPEGYEFHIYGSAPKLDATYAEGLMRDIPAHVFFHPSVPNDETPAIYRAHDIYVNLTPKGSMDKTVLEAVACGVPVIVTNASFRDTLDVSALVENPTPEVIAERIREIAMLEPAEERARTESARRNVIEKHSLQKLGIMLSQYISE